MTRSRRSTLEGAQKRLAVAAVRFTECTAKLQTYRADAAELERVKNPRAAQDARSHAATAERLLVLAEEELTAAALELADRVREAAESAADTRDR